MNGQVQAAGRHHASRKKRDPQKEKLDLHYMEDSNHPTWFKQKEDALVFMQDLETETGVKHVLSICDEGYEVVPSFLEDADGIDVEQNDLLYSADGEVYHVNSLIRKNAFEWVAKIENEETHKIRRVSECDIKCLRHSPWSGQELKTLHRENIRKNFIKNSKELAQSIVAFIAAILALLLSMAVVVLLLLGINYAWDNICVPKILGDKEGTFQCVITDKHHETKEQEKDDGSHVVVDYYYITVSDSQSVNCVRFNCTQQFYEEFKVGDPVSIEMTTDKDSRVFMVGDQKLTNYYVVTD